MRPAVPDRWVRVHSLTDSKRYPDSRREMADLLGRHNALGAEILGTEAQAILFLFAFLKESEDIARAFAKFSWANAVNFGGDPPLVHSDAGPRIVVAGSRVLWYPGAWDSLLRDVAKHKVNAAVLLNPKSGEIYAPYDGGADLFLNSPERAADLRRRWASWLPALSPKPNLLPLEYS